MPSSIGQVKTGTQANDTFVNTGATDNPTVNGSTIIAPVQFKTARAITTVTDNKGNTGYGLLGTTNDSEGTKRAVYRCENIVGGAGHVVTFNQDGSDSISGILLEAKGVLTAAALDQLVDFFLDGDGAPFVTGTTGATAQANEMALLVYWINTFGATTITWGNGYTEAVKLVDANLGTLAIAYKNLSAIGAQQGSITALSAGSETDGLIATLKDAGGGGVVVPAAQPVVYRKRPRVRRRA